MKKNYTAPALVTIQLHVEGVICYGSDTSSMPVFGEPGASGPVDANDGLSSGKNWDTSWEEN